MDEYIAKSSVLCRIKPFLMGYAGQENYDIL